MVSQDGTIRYELIETLPIYWKAMHRPELFSRTFRPIRNYDKKREEVYVFQKSVSRGLP